MSGRDKNGLNSLLDEPIVPITEKQAQLTREHARRWAIDDAEYEMFTSQLLGEDA